MDMESIQSRNQAEANLVQKLSGPVQLKEFCEWLKKSTGIKMIAENLFER